MTAFEIMSGRGPAGSSPQQTRNSGCKNDGGPLWISIDFADHNDDEFTSANLFGKDPKRSIYGRIFQKKPAHSVSRRSRRSRYAQVEAYPSETKSDLVECMALHLCTAIGNS